MSRTDLTTPTDQRASNERQPHPSSLIRCFEAAAALQRQGRWGEAEQLYRSILVHDQSHFAALHNLGYLRL